MKPHARYPLLTFSEVLPALVWLAYVCYVIVLAFRPQLLPEVTLPCAFKLLTGLPCPFCGVTRSLAHYLQGDLRQAVLYSPFSLLFFYLFTRLLWAQAIGQPSRAQRPVLTRLWMTLAALSWVFKLALPSDYW